jgi:hypothetical protein
MLLISLWRSPGPLSWETGGSGRIEGHENVSMIHWQIGKLTIAPLLA